MARGSLAGIVSGVVVSGLALGVASLSLPPVEMGDAPAAEVGDAPAEAGDSPVVIDADPSDAPSDAPEVDPAEGDATGDAAEGAESAEPAPEPEPEPEPEAEADPEPEPAAEPVAEPETAPEGDASEAAPAADPVETPDAQPAAEPLTGDETGADPASAPAQEADPTPKRGEAAETEITPQPAGTPLPDTDRAPQMEAEPVKVPMIAAEEPAAIPGTELVEKLPTALPPTGGADAAPETGPTPQAATSDPAPAPDTSDDKATGNALSVEPDVEPEPAPEIATIVAEPAPAPRTVIRPAAPAPEPEPEPEPTPEPGLSGADTVVTGRLPTIGGDAPEAEAEAADATDGADGTAALPGDPGGDPGGDLAGDLPAIERNAVEFVDAAGLPRLALLLLDDGDRVALEDIGKLPFPLTVAVDASAPDAAEAIEFYDTRGIEVALLLPLPTGATPADVDTTVQAYRPLLDAAAEVVVDPSLGFQTLGPGAAQLATNLAESGHGLVSFPAGLNTGHKEAEKQGVPAGLVFLDLDGEGQNGPVIRRFLDNAAFRARNEDGVIVLARTRSETLQALLEWSLGNRAQSVALAPISAVLLAR